MPTNKIILCGKRRLNIWILPSKAGTSFLLAHLWGAYAIPQVLSVVNRLLCAICVHHNRQKKINYQIHI